MRVSMRVSCCALPSSVGVPSDSTDASEDGRGARPPMRICATTPRASSAFMCIVSSFTRIIIGECVRGSASIYVPSQRACAKPTSDERCQRVDFTNVRLHILAKLHAAACIGGAGLRVRAALHTWIDNAVIIAAALVRLDAAVRVLRSGPRVRAAFTLWMHADWDVIFKPKPRSMVKAAHHVAVHTRKRAVLRAYNSWLWHRYWVKERRIFTARSTTRRLAYTISAWLERLCAWADARALMKKAAGHFLHAPEARAWHRWHALFLASIPIRRQRQRLDNYVHRRNVTRGWNSWRSVCDGINRLKWLRQRFTLDIFKRRAGRAFRSWSSFADARSRAMNQLDRAVRLMGPTARALARGMDSWLDFHDRRWLSLRLLQWAASHLRNKLLGISWTTWTHASISGVGPRRRRMARAASHWLLIKLSAGFTTWSEAHEVGSRIAHAERCSIGLHELFTAQRLQDLLVATFEEMRDTSRLRRAASVAVRRWANRDVIRVECLGRASGLEESGYAASLRCAERGSIPWASTELQRPQGYWSVE